VSHEHLQNDALQGQVQFQKTISQLNQKADKKDKQIKSLEAEV